MRLSEVYGCFRGLQNYTTLKLIDIIGYWRKGFRGLQNYTTLKLPTGELL